MYNLITLVYTKNEPLRRDEETIAYIRIFNRLSISNDTDKNSPDFQKQSNFTADSMATEN